MSDCYPITVLPHLSRLFREYTELRSAPPTAPVRQFYAASPFDDRWKGGTHPTLQPDRNTLTDLLTEQSQTWNAGPETFRNLDRLRKGARAVVTGQQVGLFGGPLLTLMKAATAIRKAQVATEAGIPHVPIFWMATEDHDLDEVNQVTLATKHGVETLHSAFPDHRLQEVGGLLLGESITPVLEQVEAILNFAPICDLLRASYTPLDTLGSAFAKLLSAIFRDHGLIVLDASSRSFHTLGAPVLRYAIQHADDLNHALLAKSAELAAAGYHSQVLVEETSSLLFLITEDGNRLPLRHVLKTMEQDPTRPAQAARQTADQGTAEQASGEQALAEQASGEQASGERASGEQGSAAEWKAGSTTYTTGDLLRILDTEPERLSPNALLRPVFQDSILPTSAYIGGPAEIAYFAQCRPLYEAILGEPTPVLPRLSATLIDPATRAVLDGHELTFQDATEPIDHLAQKLGARSMPMEGKRRLSTAGNALDQELGQVTRWMAATDDNLGRSAEVAASKMRYQMNRLRRLAANFQLQKEAGLRKHATAISNALFPNQHPQERLLAGIQLLAKSTLDLPSALIEEAEQDCPGHRVLDI